MKEFDKLTSILDQLLGSNGCPWDREQTMETIRSSVLEEVCELIDAIDEKDDENIIEELGDLFFNALFFCKLGEKEERFTTKDVLEIVAEKLIRRHPHVFGDVNAGNSSEVIDIWENEKQKEKGEKRQSKLDGIPKTLPSLARAQKILKKISRTSYPKLPQNHELHTFETEDDLGAAIFDLVTCAKRDGLDAEQALRKTLADLEKSFRTWEKENAS